MQKQEAILTSAMDESFVLHGPPGTGKLQCITNIIANALYKCKKVLFVAAKKAALNVVHNRLQSIDIGAFCIELHFNKSKKSSVLEQLKKATEAFKYSKPANYQSEADRLYALRKELNEYVQDYTSSSHLVFLFRSCLINTGNCRLLRNGFFYPKRYRAVNSKQTNHLE